VLSLVLFASLAQASIQKSEVSCLAVVRPAGSEATAKPGSWTADSVRAWSEAAGLDVSEGPSVWLAFPSDLCGVRDELRLTEGLVEWVRSAGDDGRLPGDLAPGSLRGDLESCVEMATGFKSEPPDSVKEMDFALGTNAWLQLQSGDRSVWVVYYESNAPGSLRPGKCKPLEGRERRAVPESKRLEFNAFPSVSVDLHLPPGASMTVRERSEAASAALERFRDEVVAASEAVRRNYAELGGLAERRLSASGRSALRSDVTRASDLPGSVSSELRSRFERDFERYGFASSDEATRFFDRAEVARRRAKLTLDFRLERNGTASGYSIEFSGPFTPRG
jgi:hypothetical protein